MTSSASTNRLPWNNRWAQPSVDQLLSSMKLQQRRVLDHMIEGLDDLDGLYQTLIWYGPSWKWTLQYTIGDPRSRNSDILCYLVPNLEAPLVCVPMSEHTLEHLNLRRLSKFVRDGVRSAKCAVDIHWATWTPNNQSEINHLMDLIKRKHKLAMQAEQAK